MVKKLGLTLSYSKDFESGVEYVYYTGAFLRATKMIKINSRWYTDDSIRRAADTVPTIKFEDLKRQYRVRMQFTSNKGEYTVVEGKINHILTGVKVYPHHKPEDCMLPGNRDMVNVFWKRVEPRSVILKSWVKMVDLIYIKDNDCVKHINI